MGITLQSAAFADEISHSFFPGPKPFGTIDFGGAMGSNHLYLHGTGEVDEMIAELVALRAEMTGDAAPAGAVAVLAASIKSGTPVVVANPPYHMTGHMIGPCCEAEDGGYICNAQAGHDGPDHVAYDGKGEQCHRWPVAAAIAAAIADEDASVTA